MRNRLCPFETSTVVAVAGTTTVTVKGEVIPGARAIRHRWFSYVDTITDLQVKFVPKGYRVDAMGGDIFHTVRACPTPHSTNRHQVELDFDLPSGVDLVVTLASATGGTFLWRLDRVAIRDERTEIDVS